MQFLLNLLCLFCWSSRVDESANSSVEFLQCAKKSSSSSYRVHLFCWLRHCSNVATSRFRLIVCRFNTAQARRKVKCCWIGVRSWDAVYPVTKLTSNSTMTYHVLSDISRSSKWSHLNWSNQQKSLAAAQRMFQNVKTNDEWLVLKLVQTLHWHNPSSKYTKVLNCKEMSNSFSH